MKQLILEEKQIGMGSLILVNRRLPLLCQPDEASLLPAFEKQPEILLEERAASLLSRLIASLPCPEGITAVSGYRPLAEQTAIYEDSLRENGREFTEKYVALPNHSEHQTGLAIDLAENKEPIDFIRPSFPNSGTCQRFREKAAHFGFIERYPQGRENITGIGWEPWHFRYVGFPHSVIINEMNMVLEDYIAFLREYTWPTHPYLYAPQNEAKQSFHLQRVQIEIGFQPSGGRYTVIEVPKNCPCLVSGNNDDGYLITLWRQR